MKTAVAAPVEEPTVMMPLKAIVIDRDIQPRVGGLIPELVGEYLERIEAGDDFPALIVYGTKGKAWLSEGFHRAEAYRLANKNAVAAGGKEYFTEVGVKLRPGGEFEAKLNARASNRTHGTKRSAADKRKAIADTITMTSVRTNSGKGWRDPWADPKVAKHCGVDVKTVAKVRLELTSGSGNGDPVEPRKVLGSDGKTYTVPPKRPADVPAPTVVASERPETEEPSANDDNDSVSDIPALAGTATEPPEFSADQIKAMQAIFDLTEAIEGGLTCNDLIAVVQSSVESGYEGIMLCLAMAQAAVERAQPEEG